MNKQTKNVVAKPEKAAAQPALRKVEARRWDKAIAPNHNNHNHTISDGTLIVWG